MTMVVVILGIITAMLVPQLSSLTEKSEAGRAAMVVQQDLERTFTLAARLRKPMVLSADNTQHIYQVKDQTDDTVRLTRRLNLGQEFGVETMTFSNTSITVQPNGVASDTLGVTLVSRNTIRHVSMTRVGLIQRTQ
jgi:type II secretory pathway pseudopilin PulG